MIAAFLLAQVSITRTRISRIPLFLCALFFIVCNAMKPWKSGRGASRRLSSPRPLPLFCSLASTSTSRAFKKILPLVCSFWGKWTYDSAPKKTRLKSNIFWKVSPTDIVDFLLLLTRLFFFQGSVCPWSIILLPLIFTVKISSRLVFPFECSLVYPLPPPRYICCY